MKKIEILKNCFDLLGVDYEEGDDDNEIIVPAPLDLIQRSLFEKHFYKGQDFIIEAVNNGKGSIHSFEAAIFIKEDKDELNWLIADFED